MRLAGGGAVGYIVCDARGVVPIPTGTAVLPSVRPQQPPEGVLRWGASAGLLELGAMPGLSGSRLDRAPSGVLELPHGMTVRCGIAAGPRLVATGGDDGVLRLWTWTSRAGRQPPAGAVSPDGMLPLGPGSAGPTSRAQLRLDAALCGHDAPIAAVGASQGFAVAVSGDAAGRVLVWSLAGRQLSRSLPNSKGGVEALAICDHTGDVLVGAAGGLELFTLGGRAIASANVGGVCCVCIAERREQSSASLVASGHDDGSVRLWGVVHGADVDRALQSRATLVTPADLGAGSATALQFGPDMTRLYAGHADGGVRMWAAPQGGGKGSHWVKDAEVTGCGGCGARFSLTERRHHCRVCGDVFCGKCSSREASLPALGVERAVRVCDACYEQRK